MDDTGNFYLTTKKILDPFWFVKGIVDRVRQAKTLDAKREFQIIREFSEELEVKRAQEIDELKDVLQKIYNVMAEESPSELRDKVLKLAEVGLFGKVISDEKESETKENGKADDNVQ